MADPGLKNNFGVDLVVNDTRMGSFTSVTGGTMSITVVENNVGSANGGVRHTYIPGPVRFEPITLSHGLTSEKTYWYWWDQIANKRKMEGYDASIIAYQGDTIKTQIARWDLEDVWVSRISGFQFATGASGNDVYIASVTLVVEDITRVV